LEIMDICDDTEVVFHQQEMSDSFARYRDQIIVANPGNVIDECSLYLTFFYDGGINYKRGADSMWPLVTSVGGGLLSDLVAQEYDGGLRTETLRDEIIPSIYETRMCQEGLFPDSESVYIFHEIIDIIHQIVDNYHE
jgi:hypothetical protein